MLPFLWEDNNRRKSQLFACACFRSIWHVLDEQFRRAVGVVERAADGILNLTQRGDTGEFTELQQMVLEDREMEAAAILSLISEDTRQLVGNSSYYSLALGVEERSGWGRTAQCELIRDVVGNPFRSISIEPFPLPAEVVRVAQAAYDQRSLPCGTLSNPHLRVLADALEEAGCANTDILSHCREAGTHVRGCWVVDLILEKN